MNYEVAVAIVGVVILKYVLFGDRMYLSPIMQIAILGNLVTWFSRRNFRLLLITRRSRVDHRCLAVA